MAGRRRTVITYGLGLVAAGAAAAVGCAPPGGTNAPAASSDAKPRTINWFSRDAAKPEDVDPMLADFRAAHPTWTVSVTPSISDEKLATLAAAGEVMDVLNWYQTARAVNESMNLFSSLEDVVKRDKWDLTQYNQDQLGLTCKIDGRLYALIYAYGGNAPFGFAYNRRLFREAGVPEPAADWGASWTWDQFADACRRLTKRTDGRQTQVGLGDYGHRTNTIPQPWDVRWLSEDYATIQCDSPGMIDAYQKYLDIVLRDRAAVASPNSDLGSGNSFYNGKTAMTTACCSAPTFTTAISAGIDWGFAPLPKGKYATPDVAPTIAGLPTLGKERDVGWTLLRYLLENARLATMQKRQPPTPKDVATWVQATYKDQPTVRAQVIVDGVKIAKAADRIRYHARTSQMETEIIAPAWTAMLAGSETAVQALRRIKPPLQAIVDAHRATRSPR
jgi:multiple sugar transport system substrate-binding protein